MTTILPYAHGSEDHRPVVTHAANGDLTIIVPTLRSLGRVVLAVVATDLFGFVFVPAVAVAYMLFATRRPRAVLTVVSGQLTITETKDDGLGWSVIRRAWPLAAVRELRPNQYDRGLYVVVSGKDSFDLLCDRPVHHLDIIASEVAAARARQAD